MRDRLAHRKKTLLHIELAPKEHGQEIGRRGASRRGGDGGAKLFQPCGMVRAQLRNT